MGVPVLQPRSGLVSGVAFRPCGTDVFCPSLAPTITLERLFPLSRAPSFYLCMVSISVEVAINREQEPPYNVCANFQLVTRMSYRFQAFKDSELPTDTEIRHADATSQLKTCLSAMFQGTDSGFCLNV